MNIAIIGTGYVGLVSGACFAEFGIQVTCVDQDEERVARLTRGELPFFEPGLAELVRRHSEAGRLTFTTDTAAAIQRSLVLFIAVGTPAQPDGSSNLSAVDRVASEVGASINGYKVVVTKSTVPVGPAQRIAAIIAETTAGTERAGYRCSVTSNPEFLREGSAVGDFMRPDRVIIGAEDDEAVAILRDLYSPLYLVEVPFVVTTVMTAELIKYAANAFLATKISFINEMANLCDATGADVHAIAKGLGLDKRIGPKFLHPGPGFGGSCLPKDTRTLVEIGREHGCCLPLLEGTIETNRTLGTYLVGKLKEMLGTLQGRTVALLGLTYKPLTDDVRLSPALDFIKALQAEGATIRAHDPSIRQDTEGAFSTKNVRICRDPYEAAADADAVAVLTEWNEFRHLDLAEMRRVMKGDVLLDSRNVYDPEAAVASGFRYLGRGRGARSPKT